jgi:hypothetical protein
VLTTTTRQLNPDERSFLEGVCDEGAKNPMKPSELGLGIGLTAGAILCGVGLVATLASQKNQLLMFIAAPVLVIAGIILFFFGANMVLSFFRWRGHAKQFRKAVNPKVKESLNDGRAEVTHVEATAVIEIEEFEDEGSGWVFDLGDERCLVLKGQKFTPTEGDAPWPNTSFEMVRTVKHGLWVGIFCAGKPLTPVQRIPTSEFPEKFVWGEMESVQKGTLREVVNRLRVG